MFGGIKSVALALFLQKAPRRKSQRPRNSRSKQRSFEALEPRQLLSGNAVLSIIPNPLSPGGYMLDASDLYSGRQISSMDFANTTGTSAPIGTVNANGTQTANGYISGNDWYQPLGGSYSGTSVQDFTVTVNFTTGSPDTATLPVTPDAITQSQVSYNGTLANPSVELSVSGIVDWSGAPYVTFYSGSGTSTALEKVAASADGSYNLSVPLSSSFTPGTFTAAATDSGGSFVYSGEPTTLLAIPAPTVGSVTVSSDDSTGSTEFQLTANDVYDTDASGSASITGVTFHLGSTSGTVLGASDGSNGSYSIDVNPSALGTLPQTVYAVATDSMGQPGDASVTITNPIQIGQFSAANNNRYIAGTGLVLTASDVMNWSGDTVSSTTVTFYPDDGTGVFNSSETPLGSDSSSAGPWTYTASTTGWTGPKIIWARASDGTKYSDPVEITVTDDIPTIDSVSASTDSSSGTTLLALTANGVNDNYGTVSNVEFWAGSIGSGTDLGVTNGASGTWTVDVNPSALSGLTLPVTVYAVATNDMSVPTPSASAPSTTISPIIVGQLTPSTQLYNAGDDITLTAGGVLDLSGTPSGVTFYTVTPSGSTSVGTSSSGTGGNWTSTSINTSGWTGPVTLKAVVTDGTNSTTIYTTIMPDTAPVIASLTASASVPTVPPPPNPNSSETTTTTIVDNYNIASGELDSAEYTIDYSTDTFVTFQDSHLDVTSSGLTFDLYSAAGSGATDPYNTSFKLLSDYSYPSWAAFEASSDFNQVFWSQVEGSQYDMDPTSYFAALNANTGAGVNSAGAAALPLALTANIAPGDNQVTSVTFYAGSPTGSYTTLGTVYDGSNGWTLYVDPSTFGGSQEFFAVATDSMGQTSGMGSPVTLSVTSVGVGPLTADNSDRYYSGESTTLTASGLTDWASGSSVNEVMFYEDETGTGTFANATYLSTVSVSSGSASYTFTPSDSVNGPATFFAVAEDTSSTLSAPVALVLNPDAGPNADSLGVSATSTDLILTANNVYSPDGSINEVQFWNGSPTGGGTEIGTSDGSTGSYTYSVALSSLTGATAHTFYAVAVDDLGDQAQASVVVDPTFIGSFTAGTDGANGLYIPGASLTFNVSEAYNLASGVNPAGIIDIYQDTSGTGVYNSDMTNHLSFTVGESGSATITVPTGWSGSQVIFALDEDDCQPVAIVIEQDTAPVVSGITASLTPPPGPSITSSGPVGGWTIVLDFGSTAAIESSLSITGASLAFTADQWNPTTYEYDVNDVVMLGGGDVQIYDDGTHALLHNYSYTTWSDFQASTDYDPVLWNDIAWCATQQSVTYFNGLVGTGSVGSDTLTLTASAYSPNGSIASVAFYAGSGTSSPLGTVTGADANGNWSLAINPSSLGGATTVTIVVTDSAGAVTTSIEAIASPVVAGQLWASSPTYYNGYSENLTLSGALTLNSGASISGVKFYLDTSGTGIYNPATAQLLGSGTSNGAGGYTLLGVNTSGWVGNQTIFAVAYDSTGAANTPVQFQLVAAPVAQPAANPNPFAIAWNAIAQVGAGAFGLAKDTLNFISNQAQKAFQHLVAGDIQGLLTQGRDLVLKLAPFNQIVKLIKLGAAGRGQLVALLAGNPALLKAVKNALRGPLNFLHARWNQMGLSKVPFPDIDKMSADDIATILTCSLGTGHFAPAGCLIGVLIVANRRR